MGYCDLNCSLLWGGGRVGGGEGDGIGSPKPAACSFFIWTAENCFPDLLGSLFLQVLPRCPHGIRAESDCDLTPFLLDVA